MGCVGAWVCGLRVNGLRERGAPGTRQRQRRMGKPLGRAAGACSASPPQSTGMGHICRQLWKCGWRLPACSWSSWFPVWPAEIPSNGGRAEGGGCKRRPHPYKRIWKSEVPSARTALAYSRDGIQAPCPEPGFAGSRGFCGPSRQGCHDPAGHWGQTPLGISKSQPCTGDWRVSGLRTPSNGVWGLLAAGFRVLPLPCTK